MSRDAVRAMLKSGMIATLAALAFVLNGCGTYGYSYGGGGYYAPATTTVVAPAATSGIGYSQGIPCQWSLPECRAGVQYAPGSWNIQQATPPGGGQEVLVVTPRPTYDTTVVVHGYPVYVPAYPIYSVPAYPASVGVGLHFYFGGNNHRRH